ncbi:hypothetical protein CKC90_21680 [Salmonella enterica]|uniref:DUF551 domain-containing protein n=1 Tax=Salmonella enterica subsp. enterica serovar Lattenkamp TaxID=2564671 RepID=A0A734CIR1_SALET|nr:hypothetical protein [Salmonella enterica]ECD9530446.1 hypothetical protein [Salmonella enterica subsp. houtenae]EDP2012773.1 hypothetical protein [Salmonella enterica subsp. enterica serovar Durban]EDU0235401.1 hypothetical protein [Salmonella enterica subsp. enterica serovar Lattenkamp]EDU2670573.1 hypothetical protein [Salmonella enterica subsp. enterica serovar Amsterdam]
MTTITREQQKQILIDTANHVISRDNTSPYSENLRELARIALASLDAKPIYQYQSGIYNDDNGETDWYWDDCDSGFYKQYAADRRRIVYTATPAPVVPLSITLPDTSSKAFWSGTGKKEVFHPETYKRWVKEAIERFCMIAGIAVEVKS